MESKLKTTNILKHQTSECSMGEDHGTELYQRMKTAHNVSQELAANHMEEAGERSVVNHDKKAFQKDYLVGDKVLLKVKKVLDKNA